MNAQTLVSLDNSKNYMRIKNTKWRSQFKPILVAKATAFKLCKHVRAQRIKHIKCTRSDQVSRNLNRRFAGKNYKLVKVIECSMQPCSSVPPASFATMTMGSNAPAISINQEQGSIFLIHDPADQTPSSMMYYYYYYYYFTITMT